LWFYSVTPFVLSAGLSCGVFLVVMPVVTLFGSVYAVNSYRNSYLYVLPDGLVLPLQQHPELITNRTMYQSSSSSSSSSRTETVSLITIATAQQQYQHLTRKNGTFDDYFLRLDDMTEKAVAAPSNYYYSIVAAHKLLQYEANDGFEAVPVVPFIFCGDDLNVNVSCCTQMRWSLLPWLLNGIIVLPVLAVVFKPGRNGSSGCAVNLMYMVVMMGVCVCVPCSLFLIPYLMVTGQSFTSLLFE